MLTQQADEHARELARGAGDVVEARDLGVRLVRLGYPENAIPLLEAVVTQATDDPQGWYWLGRALTLGERLEPGLEALARSVALAPEIPLLRFELGLTLHRAGQAERAEVEFARVAREVADDGLRRDALRRLGLVRSQRLENAGDPAAALAEIEQVLALDPDDDALLGEHARLLKVLGRFDEAGHSFRRIIELAPGDVATRMRLAAMHRERDEAGKSLEQLAAVIGIAPDSAEAEQARGMLGYAQALALIEEEAYEDSREILERMLAVVPADGRTRYQLGRVLFLQRRLAEAERQLAVAVARGPGHQEAHLLLGRIHELLDRRDSAIRAYETVLELGGDTAAGRQALPLLMALYGERFEAMVAAGRLDDAILLLRRLVMTSPDNSAARINLARLYLRTGQDDAALRELREVIGRDSDNSAAHRIVADIHASAGRHAQAVESYAAAIAADADHQRAEQMALDLVLSVARLMMDEQRPFAAIRHLRSLADADRADERAWFMLAAIYRQQGRREDAIRAFREAVRLAPDNVPMRFNLAELYERNNDDDLALVQYRNILRRGEPGDRFVEESRLRAERLRDRLALFSSQLRYHVTFGESVIQGQDIDETGALNSTFNSQLFYNLGTNFRPRPGLHLRLDTGLIYIGNHSTEDDLLIPRVGISGSLSRPGHFYNGSIHVSDIHDLKRDVFGGRTVNANLSGGLRFRGMPVLFGARGETVAETGEQRVQRALDHRLRPEPGADNPALRATLRKRYRVDFPLPTTGEVDEGELTDDESLVSEPVEEGMRLYRSGWIQLRQGRLDEARERFESVLALVPDDPLTLLNLGIVHQRRNEAAAAEQVFRRVHEADPASHRVVLLLAGFYRDSGRVDAAISLLEEWLARQEAAGIESGPVVDYLRHLESRRAEEADRETRREMLDAAGFSDGLALLAQGRHDQALARMQSILAEYPDEPLLHLNIGVIHQRQGRYPEAEAEFQHVLDHDSLNLNAALRLAMVYGETQRAARAIPLLEYVISEGGSQPVVVRAEAELERLERQRLRALTAVEIDRRDPVENVVQGRVFYTDSSLPGRALTETWSYGVGLSLGSVSVRRGEWTLDYTYGVRENEDPFGTDYAYDWHEAGVNWRMPVPNPGRWFGGAERIPGMGALLALSHERRRYHNIDTHARHALGEDARRRHQTTTLTAGLNYRVPGYDRMSYFLTYSRGISRSNLPVGLVHDPDGEPIAFQSSGLGDFDTDFLTVGLNFRF